jgi:hypothetical protein
VSKLREQILNAKDIKSEKVNVDEWGVAVEVRGMTGKSRADLMNNSMKDNGKMDFEKLYPELLISCTYDPDTGDRVFQQADRDALNNKSSGALEKVAKVAMKLSGLDPDDVEKAEKN